VSKQSKGDKNKRFNLVVDFKKGEYSPVVVKSSGETLEINPITGELNVPNIGSAWVIDMNWSNEKLGEIFRECLDEGK